MKKTTWIILSIVLGVTCYYLLNSKAESGSKAPEITDNLLDGSEFSLSDLRGNYVLIDFWGSWCPPCRKANKKLVHLYSKYHGKSYTSADDFYIVSIAMEKNDKNLKKAIEKDGLNWKHHIMRTSSFVATDGLAIKYGVTDLPSTFLIGPMGEILGANLSLDDIENYLRVRLK